MFNCFFGLKLQAITLGLLLALIFSSPILLFVQASENSNGAWDKTITAPSSLSPASIVQTDDGGYLIASLHLRERDDNSPSIFLVKVDSYGTTQWNKTMEGIPRRNEYHEDYKISLVKTSDGGFALATSTATNRTDSAGGADFWMVKMGASGNTQFSKTYGSPGDDVSVSIIQTADGGYALVGKTPAPPPWENNDLAWLVKVDSSGNMEWNKTYGWNTGLTDAYDVVQTADGGYALLGENHGAVPAGSWLVKVDSTGKMHWNKTITFGKMATLDSIIRADDGGYVLGGYLMNGTITPAHLQSSMNFLLVKTDAYGNMQWNRVYVGSEQCSVVENNGSFFLVPKSAPVVYWNRTYTEGNSKLYSLFPTSDGGYALAGTMETIRPYMGFPTSSNDFWLVKVDNSGNMQWNHAYGDWAEQGSEFWTNKAVSAVQTADKGYILTGASNHFDYWSGVDEEIWLVKTNASGAIPELPSTSTSPTPSISPTPSVSVPNEQEWLQQTAPSVSPTPSASIPECLSWILLPLFLVATMLILASQSRKR